MKFIFFVVSLMLFSAFQEAGSCEESTVYIIEQELKGFLLSKYDDFQITEIISKNDSKKLFLKNSLGEKIINAAINIDYKELYFKKLTEEYATHLGITSVTYRDKNSAKKAFYSVDDIGYLGNSKVLTKYMVFNIGDENLIVYTESVADEIISMYLNSLQKKYSARR